MYRSLRPRSVSRRRTAAALASATALGVVVVGVAPAQAALHRPDPVTWRVDLSGKDAMSEAGVSAYGVAVDGASLTLAPGAPTVASVESPSPSGSYTLPARVLDQPANRVSAEVDAVTGAGSTVVVLVRGQTAAGRWTEWRQTGRFGPATLPAAARRIQARLVLDGRPGTSAPRVSGVRLTADRAGRSAAPAGTGAAPLTYRLFATREGLVGGTTANGHVIVERDHFVALPSRRALNPNDGTRDFQVQVCYPATGRCETAPVWDVGPWNTRDDYWNPAAEREMWKDLPQGVPESQAAYHDGYNGGLDEFGRQVLNPAGIDLADGTFWDGLGMNDNDWVDVTFLWTG